MGNIDNRIDQYIEISPAHAQPILEHIRQQVHIASPDIEEKIKWGMPHFGYKGMRCSMAAFKVHCTFSFWKGSILQDTKSILETVGKTAMGNLGHIRSLKDLPSDKILLSYIKQAIKLNDDEIKVGKAPKINTSQVLEIPDYSYKELKKNNAALKTFEQFSHTNKKEYVVWISEAKTDITRTKHLAEAVEWMSEGKIRHWKYMLKKA